MSVRSAESQINSAESRVTQLSNLLASYEKQGLKADAERTKALLEQAKADLNKANATLISETQKAAQAKSDAAAEARHREEMDLQKKIAAENARATREAAMIEAEAIREAEQMRENARMDSERKAYMSKLSDEELLKLADAVSEESYKQMMKEANEEALKLNKKADEINEETKKKYDLEKRIKQANEKMNPKLNRMPIIGLSAVGVVIGLIFSSVIRDKILESTPSLWTNSYTTGNIVNYEVGKGTSSGIYWLIFLIIVGVFFSVSFIKTKRKLKQELEKVPQIKDELKKAEVELSKVEKKVEKLNKEFETIKDNGKYDLNSVLEIANEIQWKAEYALQEYESRHYTDQSVDDIVSRAKK